jgi:acid phosphatase (class A)
MKHYALLAILTALPVLGADSPPPLPVPIYLLASEADMLQLLAPPPAEDSQAQREDLQAVLAAQYQARTNHTLDHAISDAELSCARIADVFGNAAAINHDPQVLALLNEAAREATTLTGPAKNFWKRARPFAFSSNVEAFADMAQAKTAALGSGTRSADLGGSVLRLMSGAADLAHSSYPSGHATFGTVCAILLAQMVPEKRAELFARGLDYAHSRMVVGAHFPTDLEAGRLTGTVAVELLAQNARFQHDFAIERTSLRAALALSAEPTAAESAGAR